MDGSPDGAAEGRARAGDLEPRPDGPPDEVFEAPRGLGYAALLAGNRSFRRLFFARLISLLGDWFNTLAVLALLRALGRADASSFGLIIIFKSLPALFVSPVAGVLADRVPRLRLMIVSDLGRAGAVLAMLATALAPPSWGVPLLYGLVVIQTSLAALFEPARSALLPQLVRPENLATANALGAAVWSAMLTLGAAAGGLVTEHLGWQAALLIDAGTYLVSVAFLRGIGAPEGAASLSPSPRRERRTLTELLGLADMVEGFVYVVERPRVLTLLLVKAGWCLAGSITLVLTLLGEGVFPVGDGKVLGVAILWAARGIGTGAGPVLGRWLTGNDARAMERLILGGFVCGAVFYCVLPLAQAWWHAALIVALAHLGGAAIWVFSTIRLQQLVPDRVRGRVFAAEQGLFTLVLALSTYACGRVADARWLDERQLALAIGVILWIPSGLWLLRGARLGWGGLAATREAAR